MYSLKLPACQNIDKYQRTPLTQDLRSACLTLPSTQKRCDLTSQLLIFDASTRVLVWPIGLDMAAVGEQSTIQNGDKSIRMDTLLQANAYPRA
ncbi:MAG: hypothetical protein CME56_05000 [Halieaceae bacterium]|nr:hypothetical protein [Halieaceae bacterium]